MSINRRTQGIVGIAFAVVYLLGWGLTVAGLPEDFPPATAEVVAYYQDHASTAMAGSIVTALAVGLFVWFLAHQRRRLQAADGADGMLASLATGGGLIGAAVLLVSASANYVPAIRADDGSLDPATATALSDLHGHLSGAMAPLAFGVLVAATAAAGFRHRSVPVWLAWVSAVLAVGMILPLAPWVASMLFPFWVLAVSVTWRGAPAEAAADTPARAGHTTVPQAG